MLNKNRRDAADEINGNRSITGHRNKSHNSVGQPANKPETEDHSVRIKNLYGACRFRNIAFA
jgi:hypothetical protein